MTELSDALFMTSMIEIKEGIPPSELYNTETINDKLLYKIKIK